MGWRLFFLLLFSLCLPAHAEEAEFAYDAGTADQGCFVSPTAGFNARPFEEFLQLLDTCLLPNPYFPPDFRKIPQGPKRKAAFLNYWGPHAVNIQRASGIPASILLAQWAEETFWGASNLYANANNMSGHFCPERKRGQDSRWMITLGSIARDVSAHCAGATSQRKSLALVFDNPVDSAWAHAYNLVLSPSREETYSGIRAAVKLAKPGESADWKKLIPELDRHYAPRQGYGRKITNHINSSDLSAWDRKRICHD